MFSLLLLTCLCLTTTQGFLLAPEYFRNVTAVLSVRNGQSWGTWGHAEFCPEGSFAIGYDMKILDVNVRDDDIGLNAVQLTCATKSGLIVKNVTSSEGHLGQWVGYTHCPYEGNYLVAFDLQVEKSQLFGDDTAANFVKFRCRTMEEAFGGSELAHTPGHGLWGTFGDWSTDCPAGSAICGIMTSIETSHGSGDDTGLNDMKAYCCT